MKRTILISALAIALIGCGGGEAANNAVTDSEAAALDNTAEMLDASPDSLVADSEAPLGNGEVPFPQMENESAADNGIANGL